MEQEKELENLIEQLEKKVARLKKSNLRKVLLIKELEEKLILLTNDN